MAEDYGEADESDDRENRAKAELRSVISKQFKLRKGSDRTDDNKKEEEERAVLYAKVYGFLILLRFFTSHKICCITVSKIACRYESYPQKVLRWQAL